LIQVPIAVSGGDWKAQVVGRNTQKSVSPELPCSPFERFHSTNSIAYAKYCAAAKIDIAMHNAADYMTAIPRVDDERGQP
jgi:hypothetical protein